MRTSAKLAASLGACALIATQAMEAHAEQAYEEVADQLIAAATVIGLSDGFEPVGDPLFVELNEDEQDAFEFEMRGGREHAIVVVCDDDCDDVDVRLYDSEGDLIDKDTDGDDVAVLNGEPDDTEDFIVEISVEDCDREPCVVGAVLFSQ